MSERLGPVSFKLTDEDPFLGREIHQQRSFSEHTLELIDEEITTILRAAEQDALNLLREKKTELDLIARALLKEEELDDSDIAALIGPSVHADPDDDQPAASTTTAPESVDTGIEVDELQPSRSPVDFDEDHKGG